MAEPYNPVPLDIQRYECVSCGGAIYTTWSGGNMASADPAVLVGEDLYHPACWDSISSRQSRSASVVRDPWHQPRGE